MYPVLLAFLSVWNLFGLLSSEKGVIAQLSASCSNGGVAVACRLEGLDRGAVWKSLSSGETVVFTFHFSFFRERRFWFNETLHEVEINQSLSYNNLTRQFLGHSEGLNRAEMLFSDLDSAIRWASTITGRLTPKNLAGWRESTVYFQARILLDKRRVLYVLPYETVSPVRRVRVQCP